ncbi:hypothetical protein RWX45_00930, partial [Actinomyces sp. MRS3W]|nr:hypothetical protein [Actinomyces sp. MRS3W]
MSASVHPVCWYEQSDTGAERAEWIESGKAAEYLRFTRGETLDKYKTHFPDYDSYADDTDGHWYIPTCSAEYMADDDKRSIEEVTDAYLADHDPVYVPAGQAAPEPEIDGATLARAAWDAITIPTATIEYNPTVGESRATIVGMDTWIWATGDT